MTLFKEGAWLSDGITADRLANVASLQQHSRSTTGLASPPFPKEQCNRVSLNLISTPSTLSCYADRQLSAKDKLVMYVEKNHEDSADVKNLCPKCGRMLLLQAYYTNICLFCGSLVQSSNLGLDNIICLFRSFIFSCLVIRSNPCIHRLPEKSWLKVHTRVNQLYNH